MVVFGQYSLPVPYSAPVGAGNPAWTNTAAGSWNMRPTPVTYTAPPASWPGANTTVMPYSGPWNTQTGPAWNPAGPVFRPPAAATYPLPGNPYGPYGSNPPGVTWMPVVRTLPPAANENGYTQPGQYRQSWEQPAQPAEPSPRAQTHPSQSWPEEEPPRRTSRTSYAEEEPDTFTPRGSQRTSQQTRSTTRRAAPDELLTPAHRTGQQVGEWVTRILEENPQLQQQIDAMGIEQMGDQLKGSIQQSPIFKLVPQKMENEIIARLDPGLQPYARQLMSWLRTPTGTDWQSSASGGAAPAKKSGFSLLGGRKNQTESSGGGLFGSLKDAALSRLLSMFLPF